MFKTSGAFRERVRNAWAEMRENIGRSALQSLGVMLGVASVLGGFSITDSMRQRSSELYRKLGGLDKLNIQPSAIVSDGNPTALQAANLGLRHLDAKEGGELGEETIDGVSIQKRGSARVRSPYADQERQVVGIGLDFLPIDGYAVAQGRAFTAGDLERAAPLAILGSEAATEFFPDGQAIGATMRIGDEPVTVVGVLDERVFRFRKSQRNWFRWRNRLIFVPATLLTRRLEGDVHQKVDRVTFRIRQPDALAAFSKNLASLVKANHRLQEDFRLDDVAARIRRQRDQDDVYNIIFMLSGILSLIGGGMVNVNTQLASLKERVREVGVKMAIGASGREIFKDFLTEAMLLTLAGAAVGLVLGIGFSWLITFWIGVPLGMDPMSFVWAALLAGVFGFLFALYPAWKASRLSPMEALRYE